MLKGLIGDFRIGTSRAIRLGALALTGVVGLLATVSFLAAAAFIYVKDRYSAIEACLAVAGIFLALTVIAGLIYAIVAGRKATAPPPLKESAKSSSPSALADPMMLATGLQVARAIGIKRLIPVLALAGVAIGVVAGRGLLQGSDENTADDMGDASE